MGVSSIYAKLSISINAVILEKQTKVSPIFAKIRLGHKKYRTNSHVQTPKSTASSVADDTKEISESTWSEQLFNFTISYHAHLFWSLVLDLYSERTFLSPLHLGRTEIRLCRLEGIPNPYITWMELREGKGSLSPSLTHIGLKELDKIVGQIQLQITYLPFPEQALPETLTSPEEIPGGPSDEILTTPSITEPSIGVSPSLTGTSLPSSVEGMAIPISMQASPLIMRTGIEGETTISASELNREDMIEDIQSIRSSPSSVSTFINEPEEVNNFLTRIASLVLNKKEQEALRAVQIILTGFNQNVLHLSNLTLTLGYLQLQRYYNLQPIILTKNFVMDQDSFALPMAMYRYTEATTGWLGLNYSGKRSKIFSDFFRHKADYKAVIEYLELDPSDLLIFSLGSDEALRPNFFVAFDRKLNAIVLAIRGTMSFRDVLTDLVCEYVPWREGYVHSGILESGKWFMREVVPQLQMLAQELSATSIYFAGHSLGGSVAAMTTILYLESLHEPDAVWPVNPVDEQPLRIHCYSYGCPPILSYNLHGLYKNNIDCFIDGDDIVPRLCYGTAADLQLELLCAAQKVTTANAFRENPESLAAIDASRKALKQHQVNPKLYLAGNVYHLVNIYIKNGNNFIKRTVVESVPSEYFDELVVCRKMFRHHLPDAYSRAIENAWVTFEAAKLINRDVLKSIHELFDSISLFPPKGSKGRSIEISPKFNLPKDFV